MRRLFILLFALALVAPLAAQTEGEKAVPNVLDDDDGSAIDSGADDVALAYSLIRYGREQHEALPILTALRILTDAPDVVDAADSIPCTAFSRDSLLADARRFAPKNDRTLQTLIRKVERERPEQMRGPARQLRRIAVDVPPGKAKSFSIDFPAKRRATVVATGDGSLALQVKDARGFLIRQDAGKKCECRWTPRWKDTFTIHVKNNAPRTNRCVVVFTR